MLLLHYTGMRDCETALQILCDPESKVSAHYVVDEAGAVHRLVEEDRRAWHAGTARWQNQTDINSCAIGIEIVNGGHDFDLPQFPDAQMKALEVLCAALVEKYAIAPRYALGHSDVAPARKKDPGEKFDWARLAKAGVGLWVDPPPPDEHYAAPDDARAQLVQFGYDPDRPSEVLLAAFQRHYRPTRVDGRLDHSTAAALDALVQLL